MRSVLSCPSPLLQAARAALEAHISVVPIRADGTKQPALPGWKRLQGKRPTLSEVERWFRGSHLGIALVTGPVSENLIAIDFDDEETFFRWRAGLPPALGALYDSIAQGYEEITPKGGRHLLVRCANISGNQKLARRVGRDAQTVQTLIETRERGGIVIVAPSCGRVHMTGRPYLRLRGSMADIRTVTPEQRQLLYASLRAFDEMPKRAEWPTPGPFRSFSTSSSGTASFRGERPGDLFNQQTGWHEILSPHGWELVYTTADGVGQWRRPGKQGPGISATTNYGGSGLLYVFSTATFFEPERGYTKFAVYALLEHGGNFTAAAKTLAAQYAMEERGRGLH